MSSTAFFIVCFSLSMPNSLALRVNSKDQNWKQAPLPVEEGQFEMVINTFDREQNLMKLLDHYDRCKTDIYKIHVVWNEPWKQTPEWLEKLTLTSNVVVDRNPTTNLTNRFKNRDFVKDGIWQQDDDVIYDCRLVVGAFKVWERHKEQIVGYGARYMQKENELSESDHNTWDPCWERGISNIVMVTKGGFLHKKWYDKFFHPKWEKYRNMVDEHITCEDILMAMMHANHTKLPPVPLLVQKVQNWDNWVTPMHSGGHELTNHETKKPRAEIAGFFNKEFDYPLRSTRSWYAPMQDPYKERKPMIAYVNSMDFGKLQKQITQEEAQNPKKNNKYKGHQIPKCGDET
eukprot:gnl/MRDRNA2_/MRDRNA2_85399_c0_seq1.p1 gnl/MRDRNA2_/MRDRNA2_85399_c0~~gnl/MRDRNA2_/MRDRNA2_85399_c0_seq1.p1  ORF type:complete len:345 (+),score=51.20 gnl/MRDRNA2_/MRDRNA2_85399_c0_seq1:108-1142(+)